MDLQLSPRDKRERVKKLAEVERERILANLIAKRYVILRQLCTGGSYRLTNLRGDLDDFRDAHAQKPLELGNLSTYIKVLESNGLVLKEGREIKPSNLAQTFVYAIMEAATPEEMLWQPQPEEVKLCIEVLEAKDNEETTKAFLSELRSILNSGYWDNQLEDYFSKALDSPERYEEEIDRLLRADPRNRERIELFFKNESDKIYDLVESSGRLSSLALRIFVDVSEGKKALERMEEDLKGEGAERVLMAAQGCGRKLYEKFKLDFKKFLRKALGHESETVKELALDLMKEITGYHGG